MSSNPAHGEVYPIQHCDKVCQWLATGQWFSHGTAVSSTNKTDWHDVAKILLKVAFKPYNPTQLPAPIEQLIGRVLKLYFSKTTHKSVIYFDVSHP